MGSLALPVSGEVYADSVIMIYTVETFPAYWPTLQPLWKASQSGSISVISSDLALMETLTGPLKNGNRMLASRYELVLSGADMTLLPITQSILREAARLRATIPGLRTPDAIHAATALLAGCALFLTNDKGFKRIPGLPCTILDDIIAAP